jgi:hypothetical protein
VQFLLCRPDFEPSVFCQVHFIQNLDELTLPIEEIEDNEIEETFVNKAATMLIPFAELACQYLIKLPVDASTIKPILSINISESNEP